MRYMTQIQNQKWYQHEIFPLIPIFRIRKADSNFKEGFYIKWMLLELWSVDEVSFKISFVISDRWGIGFNGLLPFLRWSISFPIKIK